MEHLEKYHEGYPLSFWIERYNIHLFKYLSMIRDDMKKYPVGQFPYNSNFNIYYFREIWDLKQAFIKKYNG